MRTTQFLPSSPTDPQHSPGTSDTPPEAVIQVRGAPLRPGQCDVTRELLEAGFKVPNNHVVLACANSPFYRGVECWQHTLQSRGLAALGEVVFGANDDDFSALKKVQDLGLLPPDESTLVFDWARSPAPQDTVADTETLVSRLRWLQTAGANLHAGLSSLLQHKRIDLLRAVMLAGANSTQHDIDGRTPADLLLEKMIDGTAHLSGDEAVINRASAMAEMLRDDVACTVPAIDKLRRRADSPINDRVMQVTMDVVRTLAENDQDWAKTALALAHAGGLLGIEHDDTEAFRLLQKAADNGNRTAQTHLAGMYERGCGTVPDTGLAVKWYRAAAAQGCAIAQYRLGLALEYGQGVKMNLEEAATWQFSAASQWLRDAQYHLARMLMKGKGIEKDTDAAEAWFNEAANQGHPEAQYHYGDALTAPGRSPAQRSQAITWFEAAAKQGHPAAQNQLGEAYALGRGVGQNDNIAFDWLQSAAEKNLAVAQYNLAGMYATGRGTRLNAHECAKWLQRAADQGHVLAMYNLAEAYVMGFGLPKNVKHASVWLKAAAEQGHAPAQCELSEFYDSGRGVARDPEMAEHWLTKAAAQGYKPALDIQRIKAGSAPKR